MVVEASEIVLPGERSGARDADHLLKGVDA